MAELTDTTSDVALIERIIANNIKPHFPEGVQNFIHQDWQALLIKLSEQVGKEDLAWREAVRLLTNLSLYMEPATKRDYPRVESVLLPDLLKAMKIQLSTAGVPSQFIDSLLVPQDEVIAENTTVETHIKTDEAPVDDNVLAFDIKPEDLPDTTVKQDQSEVDRGNTIDFESFVTAKKVPPAPESTSTEPVEEPEVATVNASDLEPLEIDISDQDIDENELAELEQELTNLAHQTNDDTISAEDLPPLELDLSDFEEDKPK